MGLSAVARADVITLTPVRDNTLIEDPSGALSNGAGQFIFAGRTNQAPGQSVRRALVKFNIAAAVPFGSTITDVSLTMHMSRTLEGATITSLHRVLADWGEGRSDAPGQEGSGAAATTGSATWLHRSFDSTPWATPGGDFVAAESASTTVIGLGLYTWDATPAMLADVQQWQSDPGSNHGWLVLGDESFIRTVKRFDSRESPNASNRPTLTLTYTPPFPPPASVPAASTWGLVQLALAVLLAVSGKAFVDRRRNAA